MELSSHPCQAIINNRVLLRRNDGSVWTGFSTDVHTNGRVCTLGHARWAAGHCEAQDTDPPTRWWQSWTDIQGIVFPFGNWVTMKVVHLCPTLWDPMGYTVHGILQARILEWVAFPFPKGSSQPRNRTGVSYIAGRFFSNWAIWEAPTSRGSSSLDWDDPLGKGKATHSSILAWRITWTV